MSKSGRKLTTEQKKQNKKLRNKIAIRKEKNDKLISRLAIRRNYRSAEGYEEIARIIYFHIIQFFKKCKYVRMDFASGDPKRQRGRVKHSLVGIVGKSSIFGLSMLELNDNNLTVWIYISSYTPYPVYHYPDSIYERGRNTFFFSESISDPTMLVKLDMFLADAYKLYCDIGA